MATVEQKLEAILFYQAEPVARQRLCALLEVTSDELATVLTSLGTSLGSRGVHLLQVGDEVELVTSPEVSDVITTLRKEELNRDLGKAGAETLAVILYRGPVSRAELEYIRGVNCSFIVRNLLVRGLVDKVPNPANARSVLYQATPKLLEHLGVTAVTELPEYEATRASIEKFESTNTDEESQ